MKKKIIFRIVIGLLVFAIAALIGTFFYIKSTLVYKEIILEAGTELPDAKEFLKYDVSGFEYVDTDAVKLNVPGSYEVKVAWTVPVIGDIEYAVTVTVRDTLPPQITPAVEEVFMYTGADPLTEADFVEAVLDETDCTLSFEQAYDFSTEGQFDVVVVATDTSGNTSKITVPCRIVTDVTGPVIEGVGPFEIAQGDTVSYKKGITVTDDYDTNPSLEVDSSQVNLDKRGFYPITYIATDAAGNVTKKSTTVQIVSAKIDAATPETVNAMADKVLAGIITDGMTELDKARAIFDWVVNNITYKETAGIDDLYSAAYAGMYYHTGDCTVKQKTAEIMLNRVGIKNMEIEKIRDTRGHYWLLIDIGEGWYHYDPNLQLDGTLIFYWHDADLWAYSNAHKNTHNYNPANYPTIQ